MNHKTLNGDKSSLASADNFNEIIVNVGRISTDWLKYFLRKNGFVELGDGMYLNYVDNDDTVFRVHYPNGNWFNVVKNHSASTCCNWNFIKEQVQHIVCGHYNVPDPKYFPTFNDWANDLYEYGFCNSEKRWAKIRADYEASYPGYDEMVARYSK